MKRESEWATLASIFLLALFSFSTFAANTAAKPSPFPARPNFARIKAVSPFEIDLTWRDRSNNEDGFQIERSTDRVHFRQIAQVLPGTKIYRDKNLFPGMRYFYRIRAFNAAGSSRYSATSARTRTPVMPLSVAEWGSFWYGTVPPTNTDLVSVSAGVYHGLGLKKDGTVIAWGDNTYGQSTVPTNLTGVVTISAGQFDSLALKSDGTVVEWGYGGGGSPRDPGQPIVRAPLPVLIHPTNFPPLPPIPLPVPPTQPIHPIQPVQLIPPTELTASIELLPPQQLLPQSARCLSAQSRLSSPDGLAGVVAISAGNAHGLALKGDGTVVGWGDNSYGQATPPTNLSGVVEIAAGDTYSLALKSDGTVVQWGNLDPPPTNLTSVIALAAGPGLGMAVKSDGTVVAWGYRILQTTQATSNLTDVAAIALGRHQGVALKKDGSLFGWGIDFPSIIAPDLRTGIITISGGGSDHFLALSTAPAAPSNPFVTVLSANQLRLSWQDNSRDEKSFAVERTGYPESGTTPWVQIGTLRANATSFIDTTAQTGGSYIYRVRAVNRFGASASARINATLAPLFAPSLFSATLGATNEVNLSWYDAFGGMDSFKIERAPDDHGQPGAWTEIASDTVSNFTQYSFTDSTVQPVNKYWYRVRAANILGYSDYSAAISINVAPPPTPQYLNGSPFADSASFYWSEDSSARGAKIERAPDVNGTPGAWTQIAILDATNGSQYVDPGLAVNTTYWYRVRAYNWAGDSDYTQPISITIIPPAPPYSVSVNINLTNGVDISWYPAIYDEDGFKLERAPDTGGGPGAWTEIASFNDVHASYEFFHDTNAVDNNTYWYRVRSFNLFGFSDYSVPVSVSLVPPPAPTLTAATPHADSVNLQWQDNTLNLLQFKIERAPDAGGAPGAWTQVACLSAGESFYNDPGLTPGATYWYRIRAVNWIGDSLYSGLAAVTIDPPSTPTITSIVLNQSMGVDLTISDPAADEDGFLVERAAPTDLGFINWTQVAKLDALRFPATYWTDTNITLNATNRYRVRALNSVGVSDYSSAISIVVAPPAAPYVQTSARGNNATIVIQPNNPPMEAILGFRLQRAPDAGGHPGTWTTIFTNNSSSTYVDAGLTVGGTYWYRAQVFNWVGASAFSDFSGVMIPPTGAPNAPYAWLSPTNHQVDLYWYDFFNDEDGFTIERARRQWQPRFVVANRSRFRHQFDSHRL